MTRHRHRIVEFVVTPKHLLWTMFVLNVIGIATCVWLFVALSQN